MNQLLASLIEILNHGVAKKFARDIADALLDAMIAWVERNLQQRRGAPSGSAVA